MNLQFLSPFKGRTNKDSQTNTGAGKPILFRVLEIPLVGFFPTLKISGAGVGFREILAAEQKVSPWLTIGVSLAAGIILLFLLYILLLRRLVQIKTQSLRESEDKYRRFFMTSKDPVYITSKDGKWR